MSAIKAPALTDLEGSPAAGFVLWHSLTLPPNTVAQELSKIDANNNAKIPLTMLFILLFFDFLKIILI